MGLGQRLRTKNETRSAVRVRAAAGVPDANETFDYDALGNLVAHAGVAQEFTHPAKPHALTRR